MSKNPKIEFVSNIPYLSEIKEIQPVPASRFVPDWWKKVPYDKNMEEAKYRPESMSVRQCPSFPDVFSAGYIIPMWADTVISFDKETLEWSWKCGGHNSDFNMIIFHPSQYLNHVEHKFQGTNATAIFQFDSPWHMFTDPGYSIMQLPLFYHFNKDFSALPGIVDSDISFQHKIEIAYHGDGKEIFIKRGTPLVQMFPYKRDEFDLIVRDMNDEDKVRKEKDRVTRQTIFKNWYIKNRRNKSS